MNNEGITGNGFGPARPMVRRWGVRPFSRARSRAAGLAAGFCTAWLGSTPVALAQTAPPPAPPPCLRYDFLIARGTDVPPGSICETVAPELGGIRSYLADYGIGFSGFSYENLAYDVLTKGGPKQSYIGQYPTFLSANALILTYDLERVGLTKGSQLAVIGSFSTSSYSFANDRGAYISQLTVFQPFFDDHVEVQFGYSRTFGKFAYSIAGTTIGASALGPVSSIPFGVGIASFRPTPNADIRFLSPDKTFYSRFGVIRSVSPEGLFEDARLNPSGLRFGVPGAGALFANETGYKVESSAGTKKVWVRGAFFYNQSDYAIYNRPGRTGDNSAFSLLADLQLTQPNPGLAFQGLYLGAKYDRARDDRNPFESDYSFTLYQIGTFESRPFDVASFSVGQSYVGTGLKQVLRQSGLDPESTVFSVTGSYTYRLQGGLYLTGGLSYTDHPTIAVKRPGALNASFSITMLY